MPAVITATDISMHFGGQALFEQVNLQLNAGNCYGIVGANGSGKSTLLRIFNDLETPATGTIVRQKSARIGVLEQNHFAYEDTPIIEVVMAGNEILWSAIREKETLLENAHEHFDEDRYVVLEDIVTRFDGYQVESKASAILEGLNIPTEKHWQPLKTLSGGYKLRVLLGKALASDPDILFLDEPNNHLDILSIAWLEQFLTDFKGLALVVSHDHRFSIGGTTRNSSCPKVKSVSGRNLKSGDAKKKLPISMRLSLDLKPRPPKQDRPIVVRSRWKKW